MKLFKILTTVIGSALMITACGTNVDQVGTGDDVVNIKDIVIEEEEIIDDEIVEKTCEEISNGQCGGSLTDFLVGSYIEPTCTYTCSFTHTKTFDGKYTVMSDDRTIAQVAHAENTDSFTVKGISPGDAIIQAKTSDDEIVLQFVVHVRRRINMDKIGEHLYNVDKFYGMFYGYKLSFTEASPNIAGTLVGSDDFEASYVNFKCIEGVEERIDNGTDFNTYKFKISVDNETSVTSRNYTYVYISTTGEKIYFYYQNGIVDIFTSYDFSARGTW